MPVMEWTSEDLVIPHLQAATATEAIAILGQALFDLGSVLDTFVAAVLEREKTFATGLPTPDIQVAIPHTDPEHVVRPAIAVGIPDRPIRFGEMGSPDETVEVSLVCLLAVTASQSLISLLQTLIAVFQDTELLRRIIATDDRRKLAALFNELLPKLEEA